MEKFMKEFKGLSFYQFAGLVILANIASETIVRAIHGNPQQQPAAKAPSAKVESLSKRRSKKAS